MSLLCFSWSYFSDFTHLYTTNTDGMLSDLGEYKNGVNTDHSELVARIKLSRGKLHNLRNVMKTQKTSSLFTCGKTKHQLNLWDNYQFVMINSTISKWSMVNYLNNSFTFTSMQSFFQLCQNYVRDNWVS